LTKEWLLLKEFCLKDQAKVYVHKSLAVFEIIVRLVET
jgi:hypothetical protein